MPETFFSPALCLGLLIAVYTVLKGDIDRGLDHVKAELAMMKPKSSSAPHRKSVRELILIPSTMFARFLIFSALGALIFGTAGYGEIWATVYDTLLFFAGWAVIISMALAVLIHIGHDRQFQ